MPYTLFISDLHLTETEPATADVFIRFLKNSATKADALYILGDLFNAWIGDNDLTPFHQSIFNALKEAAKQLPIYFMRGNRDFLIGNRFAKQTGCQLLKDPTKINLYGKDILLMHGDLLCTLDLAYQRYRRFVTHPFVKYCFHIPPLFIRRWLAQGFRRSSKKSIKKKSQAMMDVCPATVEKMMRDHQADLLIHGHTHQPAIHNAFGKTRIVLSDWHGEAKYLIYRDDGKFELI